MAKRIDRLDQRRKEARARQAAYSAMDPIQILSLLDKRGFTATKERARLAKRIQ